MAQPLMPKAVVVWLVENTTLTFEQIAEFCDLHPLEVQGVADGEVASNIVGQSPVVSGELTVEEIARCEDNPRARLKMSKSDLPKPQARTKGPRYTPVSKRSEKPDAIAYILKHYPELADSQIARLIGTTKPTIAAIRDRTHPNTSSMKPRSPVEIGLCKAEELEKALGRARRAAERKAKQDKSAAKTETADDTVPVSEQDETKSMAG